MTPTKDLSIAIDGFRLVCEPLTSGAVYVSELSQALANLPEVKDLYILLPNKPDEEFRYKSLLQNEKIKFSYGKEIPHIIHGLSTVRFRSHLRWIQIQIPRLIHSLNPRPDIYIAPYHHPPIFLPRRMWVGTVIHDLCGLGVDFAKTKKGFYHHVIMLILSGIRSDCIIPISAFTKGQLQRRMPFISRRISDVVYSSVASKTVDPKIASQICSRYGLKERSYFLAFGTRGARKGFDVILDSYKLYKSNGGKIPLVLIVARRDYGSIERLVSQLNDVLLLSNIDFLDRDALYRCATALLFPSRCEGFGYPVVEAIRQGCPPIAWENTPALEIVGDAVPLLKSLDPGEVADTMYAYEDLPLEKRNALANKLIDRSLLFDGVEFGRRFFNALTKEEHATSQPICGH
jgi:glycosyltransferase involved in cell wall biosynthesis